MARCAQASPTLIEPSQTLKVGSDGGTGAEHCNLQAVVMIRIRRAHLRTYKKSILKYVSEGPTASTIDAFQIPYP